VLACASPLDEHGKVVRLRPDGGRQDAIVIKPPAPLQGLLGALLILPEVRVRDLVLDLA
jgi:hypothetical protein